MLEPETENAAKIFILTDIFSVLHCDFSLINHIKFIIKKCPSSLPLKFLSKYLYNVFSPTVSTKIKAIKFGYFYFSNTFSPLF